MNAGMYSSQTCEWETPQDLFDRLDAIYHFETDVCATAENAKVAKYYDRETDGLKQTWTGVCWMNPPYGREIGKWMHKALDSARAGAVVVCLVPARTDTAWWHDTVMQGGQIHFLRGRLKFGKAKNSAPFPSAVVVFDGRMGWVCPYCGPVKLVYSDRTEAKNDGRKA